MKKHLKTFSIILSLSLLLSVFLVPQKTEAATRTRTYTISLKVLNSVSTYSAVNPNGSTYYLGSGSTFFSSTKTITKKITLTYDDKYTSQTLTIRETTGDFSYNYYKTFKTSDINLNTKIILDLTSGTLKGYLSK